MGAEVAGPAILGAVGLLGQRQARRQANRQANEQRDMHRAQEARIRDESGRLNAEIKKNQDRVNKGIARSNRARIKGGIFGEAEPTQTGVRGTLG